MATAEHDTKLSPYIQRNTMNSGISSFNTSVTETASK